MVKVLSVVFCLLLFSVLTPLFHPAHAEQYYFNDEFNNERPANSLDSSKWTYFPNNENGYVENYTTIKESGGELTLDQDFTAAWFPLIISKNTFPSGDFSFEIRFSFYDNSYRTNGFGLMVNPPANGTSIPFSDDPLNIRWMAGINNQGYSTLQDRFEQIPGTNILWNTNNTTDARTLRIDRIGKKYLFYVDSGLVHTSSDTDLQAKYFWMGAPTSATVNFLYWTKFKVDYVRVKALNNQPLAPFLELPFDYKAKNQTFNDSATQINSFFDHEYPLLSSGVTEPSSSLGTIINYLGPPRIDKPYSSHDGYDYGRPAGVHIGDSVLAAADGMATYVNNCAPCGNMIEIDHGNGYQTRYMHMQKDGLIISTPNQPIHVTTGQPIGKVGATGNVSPAGDAGAHIHFMVVQDKNGDGKFDDNIPDGVTDPFGWQSSQPDPWPQYSFSYAGKQRTGNNSYYLWKNKLDNLDTTLPANGGVFNMGSYNINIPANTVDTDVNLKVNSLPNSGLNNLIKSVSSMIEIRAERDSNNIIHNLNQIVTITENLTGLDLSRFKTSTISFYSSNDGINWTKEPTTIDLNSNTATTQVNHFTYFALMGELADTTPPTTTAQLYGKQGQPSWYRSNVYVVLNATDDNLGVDYTLYKLDDQDWQQYLSPIIVTDEGHHVLQYYSVDKDENIEDFKTSEFNIDQTLPEAKLHIDQITNHLAVEGLDKSPTSIMPTGPDTNKMTTYKIYDSAGNLTTLVVYDQTNTTDEFVIQTIQYGNQSALRVPYNLLLLSQHANPFVVTQKFAYIDSTLVEIDYNGGAENQSKIYLVKNGSPVLAEIRPNLFPLFVKTNQGSLLFSY